MIFHHTKCLFIHIPKCAGSSIEIALSNKDVKLERGMQDHRSVRQYQPLRIKDFDFSIADNYCELLRRAKFSIANCGTSLGYPKKISSEEFDEYFKFSIVRNPWGRVYSWYKNVMRDKHHQSVLKINSGIDFEEFVIRFSGKGPLRTQLSWLYDYNGRIGVDYVGRFEDLDDEIRIISKKIGLEPLRLGHQLKGGDNNYLSKYTKKAREHVSKTYEEEISMFGYAFDH